MFHVQEHGIPARQRAVLAHFTLPFQRVGDVMTEERTHPCVLFSTPSSKTAWSGLQRSSLARAPKTTRVARVLPVDDYRKILMLTGPIRPDVVLPR